MCGLPPDKSNRDALLDDGGIDQTALHLPQVRGDDVDMKLGKLEGRQEGDTPIIVAHGDGGLGDMELRLLEVRLQ